MEIELIILAAIAVFVISRLYSVLGQRNGSEPPPRRTAPTPAPGSLDAARTGQGENDRPKPPPTFTGPAASGLERIASTDPDFSPDEFARGARKAYELIVSAFADGDKQALRPLLDDDVYEAFSAAIDARRDSNEEPMRLLRLRNARIVEASVDDDEGFARVHVRFESELSDGETMRKAREIWTFKRPVEASDPNWVLDEVEVEA